MTRRRATTLTAIATPGLIASAAISLIVHAGAGVALYGISRSEKTGTATDVPKTRINETLITLAPEPRQTTPTAPEIPTPPPPPPPTPTEKITIAPPPKPVKPDVFSDRRENAEPATESSLAQMTTTTTTSAAPAPIARATFATVDGDRAARIVYVVDASGSMATSLPFVRDELVRSVYRLDSSQSFQVIVTRQAPGSTIPEVRVFSGGAMLNTSELNITSLVPWLGGISPLGRSAPLAGLEAALRLEPDLVFLLSRSIRRSGVSSATPRVDEVLARLDIMNPRRADGTRRTAIRAVQFVDDDPTGLMQAIAREHGGVGAENAYRVLTIDDVNNN
jgi:hypothetical protein